MIEYAVYARREEEGSSIAPSGTPKGGETAESKGITPTTAFGKRDRGRRVEEG